MSVSALLDRLPFRWRKIGVVHVTAAVGIISSLKYIQYQHNQSEERKRVDDLARRRRNREEREERERAVVEAQQQLQQLQTATATADAATSSRS